MLIILIGHHLADSVANLFGFQSIGQAPMLWRSQFLIFHLTQWILIAELTYLARSIDISWLDLRDTVKDFVIVVHALSIERWKKTLISSAAHYGRYCRLVKARPFVRSFQALTDE